MAPVYAENFGGLTALAQRDQAIRDALNAHFQDQAEQKFRDMMAVQQMQDASKQRQEENRRANAYLELGKSQLDQPMKRFKLESDFQHGQDQSSRGIEIKPEDVPSLPKEIVDRFNATARSMRPQHETDREIQSGLASFANAYDDRRALVGKLNEANKKRDKKMAAEIQSQLDDFDQQNPGIASIDPKVVAGWLGTYIRIDPKTGKKVPIYGRFPWEPEPSGLPKAGVREGVAPGYEGVLPAPFTNPNIDWGTRAMPPVTGAPLITNMPEPSVTVTNRLGQIWDIPVSNLPAALERKGGILHR